MQCISRLRVRGRSGRRGRPPSPEGGTSRGREGGGSLRASPGYIYLPGSGGVRTGAPPRGGLTLLTGFLTGSPAGGWEMKREGRGWPPGRRPSCHMVWVRRRVLIGLLGGFGVFRRGLRALRGLAKAPEGFPGGLGGVVGEISGISKALQGLRTAFFAVIWDFSAKYCLFRAFCHKIGVFLRRFCRFDRFGHKLLLYGASVEYLWCKFLGNKKERPYQGGFRTEIVKRFRLDPAVFGGSGPPRRSSHAAPALRRAVGSAAHPRAPLQGRPSGVPRRGPGLPAFIKSAPLSVSLSVDGSFRFRANARDIKSFILIPF